MEIRGLCRRLERIQVDLAPDAGNNSTQALFDDAGLDEFDRTKRRCALLVSEARLAVQQRDELLQGSQARDRNTIEVSSNARKQVRLFKDEAKRLKELASKERRQFEKRMIKTNTQQKLDQLSERDATVDLVWKHVDELETLEKSNSSASGKSRKSTSVPESRQALLGPAPVARSALDTELASIDPQVQLQIEQLQQRDQAMDQGLNQISAGLMRIKGIALDMGEELKVQDVMLDELETKIDDTTGRLNNLNTKLKTTIETVGGAQRVILNAILLIILLAVGAYLYESLK